MLTFKSLKPRQRHEMFVRQVTSHAQHKCGIFLAFPANVAWSVCLSVCLSVRLYSVLVKSSTKTDEPIEMRLAWRRVELFASHRKRKCAKIVVNNTKKLFFKTAIGILLISNRNSFRVLFDKIASVYFI